MRAITARVTAANPVAYVRLDELHGAALAVQAVLEGVATYQLDYTFEDPNDLISPVPLASIAWDQSMLPAGIKAGNVSGTFSVAAAPMWARMQWLSGASSRAVFTQYEDGGAFQAAAVAPPAPTYTAFASPAPFSGAYTFNLSIPGVGVGRGVIWFAVAIGDDDNTQSGFAIITLGGQAPTGEIAQFYNGGMWYYDNTAGTIPGTTATLALTMVNAQQVACVASGLLTNLNSPTPTIFAAQGNVGVPQPYTFQPITVAPGGFGIAVTAFEPSTQMTATPFPLTWTGATRDSVTEAFSLTGNGAAIGAAHLIAGASPVIACGGQTCNFYSYVTMAAAWR